MLYLEDYLDMIEHLPQELRDRFTEIRELDLLINNAVDHLNDRVSAFFPGAEKMEPAERDADFEKIRQDYKKTLEDADEKVQLADEMVVLAKNYIRRLDQELAKFKLELEASDPGITEILEKRSLELDNRQARRNSPTYPRRKKPKPTQQTILLPYNPDILIGAEIFFCPVPTEAMRGTIEETRFVLPGLPTSSSSESSANLAEGRTAVLPPPTIAVFGSSVALAAAASQAIAATQLSLTRGAARSQPNFSQKRRRRAVSRVKAVSSEENLEKELTLGDREINSVAGVCTPIAPKELKTRVTRNSRPISPALEDSEEEAASGRNKEPGEPRYCFCNQISYGDMVACDNKECPFEWFHYKCVSMTQPPRGKWFCLQCSTAMKRRNRNEK